MSNWHTYTFEEIQIPYRSGVVYADGTVDLRFDRDGIIDVTGWKIKLTYEDGEPLPITVTVDDLQSTIWEQIKWHAEEDCYGD